MLNQRRGWITRGMWVGKEREQERRVRAMWWECLFIGPPPAVVIITKIAYKRPGSFCVLTNAQKTLPEVPQPASGRAGIHTRQAGP